MNSDPKQSRLKRVTIAIVSRCLATVVAASFLATLLPIYRASAKSMACCVGKTASHCHSGLTSEESSPRPNHNTIVATDDTDPSLRGENTSRRSAAESTAVRNLCHSDCCACSVSTVRQQQKRERATAQAKVHHDLPLRISSRSENIASVVSSDGYWAQTSPRGPPSFLF